jgi:two-component system response regulator DesR
MTARAAPAGDGRRHGTSVLVLDREEVSLWGYVALFGREPWIEDCSIASHPAEALAKARDWPPDVTLLDASWGAPCLDELIADLRALRPGVRVVRVGGTTTPGDPRLPGPAVMKTWSAARLVRAVRAAADAPAGAMPPPATPAIGLSEREREVLGLAARGATNREIGTRLYLSPHTVKQHTCSAYRKLHARNRTEAVSRARDLGLIAC